MLLHLWILLVLTLNRTVLVGRFLSSLRRRVPKDLLNQRPLKSHLSIEMNHKYVTEQMIDR